MRSISIFGATGSIGQSTADIIRHHRDKFDVRVVTANTNADKLAALAKELDADYAVIADESCRAELTDALAGTDTIIMAGQNAVMEAACMDVDLVMAGIVGMAGLPPLMKSIEHADIVAIANKEPLVAAGEMVMVHAAKHKTKILPTDSEHNAIFQVFEDNQRAQIERIILTASGGPFRTYKKDQLNDITPEQAIAHPNWSMGAKISVDSATMMNKALEIIEAHYLFNMPPDKIDVRIHPQSIIHSMVEYKDGSVLAQLGAPDMRTPIAYCLGWPERIETSGQKLDWAKLTKLEFGDVDNDLFPAVGMAYDCLAREQAACITFNAANEVAVEAFLARKIAYLDIGNIIAESLSAMENKDFSSLDDILSYDTLVRQDVWAYINDSGNRTVCNSSG